MVIVQHLFQILPAGYVAAPGVHLGTSFEIDVSAYVRDDAPGAGPAAGGGIAVAARPSAGPTLTLETDLPDQDEYEVRVYDVRHGRRLVAAIEIVSPGNKDRPESRAAFVAKVAALLQRGVCVSLVDLVTIRQANLFAELLRLIGQSDPAMGDDPPATYAVTCRGRKRGRRKPVLEIWNYPMTVGARLPDIPIWLDDDLDIWLNLETTYEETCRFLHIS
jgi:hypothetical protein